MKSKLDSILQKYDGVIISEKDLIGDLPPSGWFYILANHLDYLLDNNPEAAIPVKGVERCRRLHVIFKKFGSKFLANPQIFENRNFLRNPHASDIAEDSDIVLSYEPVIWTSNHGFKDDGLATILAAQRHAYLLFGSLPQFYNTIDGITAWLNGVVMFNRKAASSRHSSIAKAVRAMRLGTDLIAFPEGVWNKSPNALLIDLWSGIYKIACETGAKIVPVVHYIHDTGNTEKNNPIHTVVDDPVRIDDLSERAALDYIRDILATWFYLMMEVYGKTTRKELLGNLSPGEIWERKLIDSTKLVARYDKEIELNAAFRPKWKTLPQDVWKAIADIKDLTKDNMPYVLYARQLIERLEREDYQRRF